jgi:deoxycytidylate deaminase
MQITVSTETQKVPTQDTKVKEPLQKRLARLQSPELIIGLSGPVGCGIDTVADKLASIFQGENYLIQKIKLSHLIVKHFTALQTAYPEHIPGNLRNKNLGILSGYNRIESLMDAGDYLRQVYEPDFLAQSAVEEINKLRIDASRPDYEELPLIKESGKRITLNGQEVSQAEFANDSYSPKKTIYLIDQLKHPSEAKLFRTLYGDIFYLLGILSGESERKKTLKNQMAEEEATKLMERDRKASEDHGQQLDKTLQLSDYFVRFSDNDLSHLEKQISRFINIMHGGAVITPTADEYGMYIAYSASLKSACLSRQVGASIADPNGTVLATGCNDVPKFNGGLYTADSQKDLRCYNSKGICYNDDYKAREIQEKLENILIENHIPASNAKTISQQMFSTTRLKDLIEFSRAIHAEMDAIIALTRRGSVSTLGTTLYTTTYPCHNCARHIVAAGIHKVVFIEPYEKSLAIALHADAISTDSAEYGKKVVFNHFEGVSPRRYQHFFMADEQRKSNGKLVERPLNRSHKSPELLDSYRKIEVRIVQHFETLKSKKLDDNPQMQLM